MNYSIIVLAASLAVSGAAFGQSANGLAQSGSASDAGAMAHNTVVFEAAEQRGRTTIFATPPIYTAPSTVSMSPYNCGGSDTMTIGTPWGGFGGSSVEELPDCMAQANAVMAWKMNMQDVAILRLWCFGSDANRMAFEASGRACPSSATAKGIPGAPVGPKFAVAPAMTLTGRIGPNGVTYE